MKRFLFVLVSSVALSAWGQNAQGNPAASGVLSLSDRHSARGEARPGQTLLVPNGTIITSSDLENMVNGQQGCPVQVVNASFVRPGELMLTGQGLSLLTSGDTGPTLQLSLRNMSLKRIASVEFTGWLKVKDSPYQLDSVIHPFRLEMSRKVWLQHQVDSTQSLALVANAIGFDRVELSSITYLDGTTWKPARRNCVYRANGNLQQAEAR